MATTAPSAGPSPAAKATKSMNDAITQSEFEAQIATLREEIAKLSAQVASSSERSYEAARKAASLGVEQLRSRGEEAMEGLRTNASDLENQVSQAVREKPVTSLAIAAGIGFLFALIARR